MFQYVCMYFCMHVCMYFCMHVCMYVCTYVCTYVCIYVCTYVSTCVCTYVRTYVRTYVCMYVCMYVCACVCVCVCVYVWMYVGLRISAFVALLTGFESTEAPINESVSCIWGLASRFRLPLWMWCLLLRYGSCIFSWSTKWGMQYLDAWTIVTTIPWGWVLHETF